MTREREIGEKSGKVTAKHTNLADMVVGRDDELGERGGAREHGPRNRILG